MPNRFDIFITRLETKAAREAASSHPIGDRHRSRHDRRDAARLARGREPLTGNDRAEQRDKHDA